MVDKLNLKENHSKLFPVALSIRQPWAWLISHGHKDVENRSWKTNFRGKFYIHAAKGMTYLEYDDAQFIAKKNGIDIPEFNSLKRGGIVGVAEIYDCVDKSKSPWFFGKWGFLIKKARPIAFQECNGALGFFNPSNISIL